MAKDLSSAYRYLEIARACLDLGDGELAVAWAERGMAAFPEFTDSRLREFLADRYLDRGRGEEALALDWALFVEDPGAERYTRLRRHAEALGVWPAWRERALDRVRPGGAGGSRDASRLVDLLLSEGDHDAAWAEANRHGCDSARWSALALARQAEHPGDAADAYRRQLAPTLAWASDAAYRDAVALLRLIRDLLSRAGRSAEFPSLVASLRRQHARRRKFLARLDRAGMG